MGREIRLSKKESRRVYVMERVAGGQLTVRQGAELLGLSERQVKRLKRRVAEAGVAGLVHGNRDRRPVNAIPGVVRDTVLDLASDLMKDASCQHVTELLGQGRGIYISARSIRRILQGAGLRNRHSRRCPRSRRSRDRMPQEGLLVQCDASPYAWLEERGPTGSLHGIIDDATGKVLGLHFRSQEDLMGYLIALRQMVEHHGIPQKLYSDRHSIFFSPVMDKLSIEDELMGRKVNHTHLGRALEELGIAHIPARSPQAKGRVERLWGTLQHRLVVELRLAGITTLHEANAFLPAFMERHNQRFAVPAAVPKSAFSPCPDHLDRIICPKHTRKVSNGSTISYHGRIYHLVTPKGKVASLRPRAQVAVLCHLDGSISALYKGNCYSLEELLQLKPQSQESKAAPTRPRTTASKPKADHPWRRPISSQQQKRSRLDRYFDDNWESHWQSVIQT